MPDKIKELPEYQKNALIENVAKDFLDDDKLRNLLDFLEFLKCNKLTPRRVSSANWVVKRKGKNLCNLRLNVEEPFWSPTFINATIKGWRLTLNHYELENCFADREKHLFDDDMKQFIWDYVQEPRCPKNCQNTVTVLGKDCHPVCRCEPIGIKNPESVALSNLKKAVLIILSKLA